MHRINLLPPAAIHRFRQQRLWQAWRKGLVLALLLTAGSIIWGQTTAASKLRKQAMQTALAEHPRRIRQECGELKAQLRELQNVVAQQLIARGQHSPLVAIALLHDLKQQLGGQLQVKSFGFVDQGVVPTSTAPNPVNGYVDLQLLSTGSASCARVMQLLRETQCFSAVSLSSSLEKVDASSDTLQYSLHCEF